MNSHSFWDFTAEALNQGIDLCLVVMVEARGHGPNRPGCHLAVTADGRRRGTVGGGASEFALVEAARAALASPDQPDARLITMDHRDQAGDTGSGMICSGTQVFALLCLTSSDLPTVQAMVQACRKGSRGRLRLSVDGLSFDARASTLSPPLFDAASWSYEETLGHLDTVTLVGGGHVALALSPLLAGLGMKVVVLDNRPDLATMKDNTFAWEKHVVDYALIRNHIPSGSHSFVCIMTFGHRHDEDVLAQLVDYPLGYLGMMGSEPKILQVRENLLGCGVSPDALNAVHAPIGLAIGSNTPEEIAISIAAQLIAVRNAN